MKTSNQILSETFANQDMGLASCLVSLGFELLCLEKSNPRSIRFVFKNNSELEKAVNDFWNDSLLVPARKMLDCQRMLKKRIFDENEKKY